jgi:hypothetical protein
LQGRGRFVDLCFYFCPLYCIAGGALLFNVLFLAALIALAPSTVIPAGTKIPIHVTQTISSHDAKTGQTFTFYVDQDVVVSGSVVIPRCAAGIGTVTLAGKHGINGHEGNLRLRFDKVMAADGSPVALAPDEQAFNGKNRKALSFFTTRWINGDDVEVKPDKDLFATVAKDTTLTAGNDPAPVCPAPSASPAAAQQ